MACLTPRAEGPTMHVRVAADARRRRAERHDRGSRRRGRGRLVAVATGGGVVTSGEEAAQGARVAVRVLAHGERLRRVTALALGRDLAAMHVLVAADARRPEAGEMYRRATARRE